MRGVVGNRLDLVTEDAAEDEAAWLDNDAGLVWAVYVTRTAAFTLCMGPGVSMFGRPLLLPPNPFLGAPSTGRVSC